MRPRPHTLPRGGRLAVLAGALAVSAIACGGSPSGRKGELSELYAAPPGGTETVPLQDKALSIERVATALPPQVDEYEIGPNDVLNILVLGHEELSSVRDFNKGIVGTIVKKDGNIYLPIVGKIRAAGYSVEEFHEVLRDQLKAYVVDPQVSIDVLKYESQKFFVLGFVKEPGAFPVDGDTTLLEAIGLAKGVLAGASLERAYVIRNGELLPINLADLLLRGDTSRNVYMKDRDLVYIPSGADQKVYVLGEVRMPGAVLIEDGRLSLAQALAEAGGLLAIEADDDSIKLIRGSWQEPTVYTLGYDTVLEEGDRIQLRAGDRIVVAPTALTTMTRYMQQILPFLEGANTSLDIAAKTKALVP
jgi:polysaccharide biosynthesis/export protein